MTKIINKDFKADVQLKAIELLDNSLSLPAIPNVQITNFNITIESKADAINKFVFVIVSVEIKNDDQTLALGSIRVSCIYYVTNFEEMIKTNKEGLTEINPALLEIINSISISTTRGVMFSTFKGTFLHNAILPLVDPKQIHVKHSTK